MGNKVKCKEKAKSKLGSRAQGWNLNKKQLLIPIYRIPGPTLKRTLMSVGHFKEWPSVKLLEKDNSFELTDSGVFTIKTIRMAHFNVICATKKMNSHQVITSTLEPYHPRELVGTQNNTRLKRTLLIEPFFSLWFYYFNFRITQKYKITII